VSIVLTSSGQLTEPKECTVFSTKHNNSNFRRVGCALSEMNLVTIQACELSVTFTVECFQHSIVVLYNMRQGSYS